MTKLDHGAYVASEQRKARELAERHLRDREIDIDKLARSAYPAALARMPRAEQLETLAAATLVAERNLSLADTPIDAAFWALRMADAAEDLRLLIRFDSGAQEWMQASGEALPGIDRWLNHARKIQANVNPPATDAAVRTAYLKAREAWPGRQKLKAIEASGFGRTRISQAFGGKIP